MKGILVALNDLTEEYELGATVLPDNQGTRNHGIAFHCDKIFSIQHIDNHTHSSMLVIQRVTKEHLVFQ